MTEMVPLTSISHSPALVTIFRLSVSEADSFQTAHIRGIIPYWPLHVRLVLYPTQEKYGHEGSYVPLSLSKFLNDTINYQTISLNKHRT